MSFKEMHHYFSWITVVEDVLLIYPGFASPSGINVSSVIAGLYKLISLIWMIMPLYTTEC